MTYAEAGAGSLVKVVVEPEAHAIELAAGVVSRLHPLRTQTLALIQAASVAHLTQAGE